MLAILKNIPLLVRLWQAAKNLEGVTQSRTTKVNALVLSILALAVSALGMFLPEFASQDVQQAVLLALLAVVGTIGTRIAGYKDRTLSPDESCTMLVGVRKKKDTVWRTFEGTVLDAKEEGWDTAVDIEGFVWELKTPKRTGAMLRVGHKGTDEQSEAKMAQMVAPFKKDQQ